MVKCKIRTCEEEGTHRFKVMNPLTEQKAQITLCEKHFKLVSLKAPQSFSVRSEVPREKTN